MSGAQKIVYLDLSGGLSGEALAGALAALGEPDPKSLARVFCSPLPTGFAPDVEPSLLTGLVIQGASAPVDRAGLEALLSLSPSFGPLPPLLIRKSGEGHGKGARVRAFFGELQEGVEEEALLVLEANLDDLPPQLTGVIFEKAFAAGALDVWAQPILMKKGRPGLLLGALCRPASREALLEVFFRESTTLGVRISWVARRALLREYSTVETEFGPISIKLGRLGGEVVNAHPEFEECRARAEAHHVPVKRVLAAALAAFWKGTERE